VDRSELEVLADRFRALADIDFRGVSPLYECLTRAAAEDPALLSLLLPAAQRDRRPHLLFAAVQYLLSRQGSDPLTEFGQEPFPAFRSWCLGHRPEIEDIVATHVVQTNEVGRCAALLPCLAVVAETAQQPLAILEVGASAGLNLLFDRYRYVYGTGPAVGAADSDVVLQPRLEGDLVPNAAVPSVSWRLGLDRLPVDVTDDDAVSWLRACIWPEQHKRIELLTRAVAAARRDPPTVVRGDAVDSLRALVRAAPEDAALCVVHTAVLPYIPDYTRFTDLIVELARSRPLWWVSGEVPGVVRQLREQPKVNGQISFIYGVVPLGIPGQGPRTLARGGGHGTWLEWLDPTSARPRT
jgi:hypothetical protein